MLLARGHANATRVTVVLRENYTMKAGKKGDVVCLAPNNTVLLAGDDDCETGKLRSATVVLAYRVSRLNESLRDA